MMIPKKTETWRIRGNVCSHGVYFRPLLSFCGVQLQSMYHQSLENPDTELWPA